MDSVHRIEDGQIWVHKKSKELYVIQGRRLVKINGDWIDCIEYTTLYAVGPNDPSKFARTVPDFLNSFEKHQ